MSGAESGARGGQMCEQVGPKALPAAEGEGQASSPIISRVVGSGCFRDWGPRLFGGERCADHRPLGRHRRRARALEVARGLIRWRAGLEVWPGGLVIRAWVIAADPRAEPV